MPEILHKIALGLNEPYWSRRGDNSITEEQLKAARGKAAFARDLMLLYELEMEQDPACEKQPPEVSYQCFNLARLFYTDIKKIQSGIQACNANIRESDGVVIFHYFFDMKLRDVKLQASSKQLS